MKIHTFLLFFIVLVACTTASPTPILQTGVHLQAEFEVPELNNGQPPSHAKMEYLLYFPVGYEQDSEREWPLIMFLHGSGDSDNDSAYVIGQGLPEVLHLGEAPEDFPFIVVSPQAFPNTPWWVGDTLDILNLLLDEVIEKYHVDRSRIYLTGLSMGGYGAWWMATAYPERFAAMMSVSGSGYRTPGSPPKSILCGMKDVPVWVIHGAQDGISAPEAAKYYAFAFQADCEGEAKFTMYPDSGHFEAWRKAYREPEVYDWLLEHSKAQSE